VRGVQVWLNRTEIDSKDLCLGVSIGKVNCPNASSCSCIKSASYRLVAVLQWTQIQLSAESKSEEVVLQVETFLLRRVIGEYVID
jgi:hypothetical protein